MMSKSAIRSLFVAPPLPSEKIIRSKVPNPDAIQNEIPTALLFFITEMTAVAKGMTAEITATCAEVDRCRASAINIGQPKTPPRVVKTIGLHSVLGRGFTPALSMRGIAMSEAMMGRAKAVNKGSKL